MKNFLLIFAFVPSILAFMGSGPSGVGYVFWSLLLLCSGIEVCSYLFRIHSEFSAWIISATYEVDSIRAMRSGNGPLMRQHLRSLELFDQSRGAA